MTVLKKLLFAPFFLIVFITLIYQLDPLLKSYDFIFSVSLNTLLTLIIITSLISLSSLIFILFAALAQNWKLVIPLGILASFLPFIFLDPFLSIVLGMGILVSLAINFLTLENTMKSYLTFNSSTLLGPVIRHLSALLILVICITYFLSINKVVFEKGFQIPDSLIDTALKVVPQEQSAEQTVLPKLSNDQIDLLKKNPQLLKQSGLDPSILDTLNSSKTQNSTNDVIKQTVKDQVQTFIKPYLGFIPAVLALLLFLTLQSLTSIFNLLIYPLIWLVFYLLEKTGYISFTTEMRPVKKMVV